MKSGGFGLRQGLTIVELLVVLGITMLLAAIVLPTVKESIRDRRAMSAAVQARAFFDAARIRAISRNREVAVVIERRIPNPAGSTVRLEDRYRNAGVSLSMAEVLPPYRGDFEDAKAVLSPFSTTPPPIGYTRFEIDLLRNPNAKFMITLGDTISLAGRNEKFEIAYLDDSQISGDVPAGFDDQNTAGPAHFLYVIIKNPGPLVQAPQSTIIKSVVFFPAQPLAFKVYGKPRRLFFKPVDLPKQMCVDLSLSGIGLDTSVVNAGLVPGFSIPNGSTLAAATPLHPVYIVFGADGTLSRIFTDLDLDNDGFWTLTQVVPTSDIYLAIGKSEQIQSFATLSIWDNGTSTSIRSAIASRDKDFKWNLSDSGLQWVKIALSSGQVSNGPALEPKITAANAATKTFADMLYDSRQGLAIGFESSAK